MEGKADGPSPDPLDDLQEGGRNLDVLDPPEVFRHARAERAESLGEPATRVEPLGGQLRPAQEARLAVEAHPASVLGLRGIPPEREAQAVPEEPAHDPGGGAAAVETRLHLGD